MAKIKHERVLLGYRYSGKIKAYNKAGNNVDKPKRVDSMFQPSSASPACLILSAQAPYLLLVDRKISPNLLFHQTDRTVNTSFHSL